MVASEQLPNMPGNSVSARLVSYRAWRADRRRITMRQCARLCSDRGDPLENSATGPARLYRAGESFFEPPGSEHLVSENASATEPASLLAVFVASDGAELTHFDQ